MDTWITLQNRIDFCGIIIAERCNPNGDPLSGNTPRQDFSGHGIISDVCLKRKIRDRLKDNGYDIFVARQDDLPEGQKSLRDRVKADPDLKSALKAKDARAFRGFACKKWIDVRAFGQVFAFKESGGGISESIRGPVSIQHAVTLDPVLISSVGVTKVVNSNDPKPGSDLASDTMGYKFIIDQGVYVFYGSMYPQLAINTSFTYADALAIREAILRVFQNDASCSRPSGSMTLDKLYWWEHNCPSGQYSPIKVFRSLRLRSMDTYPYYTDTLAELPGLKVDVFNGW